MGLGPPIIQPLAQRYTTDISRRLRIRSKMFDVFNESGTWMSVMWYIKLGTPSSSVLADFYTN
jgi:hypothetical protein